MSGFSDSDLHTESPWIMDVQSPWMLTEDGSRLLTSRRLTEENGLMMAGQSKSALSSVSSATSFAIAPIPIELGANATSEPTSNDWPTLEKKSSRAASAPCAPTARPLRAPCAPLARPLRAPCALCETSGVFPLRRLEGDPHRLNCESCIVHLRKEQEAGLAEMRSTAAQLEAAIADCRRELEAQRQQIMLQADAALEAGRTAREAFQNASRVSSHDASRDEMREAVCNSAQGFEREVTHAPRSLPVPAVAAAELQELRLKMHAGLSESACVSQDECHGEMRQVRMKVQAMQQDLLDNLTQLAQTAVLTGGKEQCLAPKVTDKGLSDEEKALAEPCDDIAQLPCIRLARQRHHPPKVVAASAKAAVALTQEEHDEPSLWHSFDIMSSSISRLADDFDVRLSRAAELAAADRAEVGDLRSLLEDAFRALAKELAEERADRCAAVDQAVSCSNAVAVKTATLIDEITEMRWNGLIVGHERSPQKQEAPAVALKMPLICEITQRVGTRS